MPLDRRAMAALVDAVADGRAPDWNAIEAADEKQRLFLDQLRIVATVAEVHRRFSEDDTVELKPSPVEERRWGRLRLIEKIGQGAFGEVHRARDTALDRRVALKLLHAGVPHQDRILEEGRLLARLRHPNVVTVYGAEAHEGRIGLWMEFVRGTTLHDLVRLHGRFGASEAAVIGRDVCRALAAVHAAGLIHGDVKARNVMRESGGRVVLMDFGACRDVSATGREQFRAGTPYYAAPELLEGAETSTATDIYAVGVLLYYLTTEDYPTKAASLDGLRAAHREGHRERLQERRPDLPDAFVAVVEHALAPDPEGRFRSAAEMQAALGQTLGVLGVAPPVPLLPQPRRTSFRLIRGMAAIVLMLGGATPLLWRYCDRNADVAALGVLPFENRTGDTSWSYVATGLADDVASELQRLHLVVRGRSARADFQPGDPREAAATLGVDRVIAGSLGLASGRVVVDVKLFGADANAVWTRQYTERVDDVATLSRLLARDIASALGRSLAAAAPAAPAPSFRAYRAYHTGRVYWEQRTQPSLEASIQHFREAIALDAQYAAPWAGLADTYSMLGVPPFGGLGPQEARRLATESALRAVELDPGSAEAHTSFAFIAFFYNWDWATAEARFRRALEIAPSYAVAHHWYADFLNAVGRHEDAWREIEEARRLEPSSRIISRDVAWHQFFRGEYEEAVAQLRATLQMAPDSIPVRTLLARALTEQGEHAQALRELTEVKDRLPEPAALGFLAYAHAAASDRSTAERLLARMLELQAHGHVSPYAIALVQAKLGNKAEALDWLDRALAEQDSTMVNVRADPRFGSLRSEARFRAIVERMRFPSTH